MPVIPFTAKDGSQRFTCVECKLDVLAALPDIKCEDGDSLCMVCRFIRSNPQLKPETIALLRS